MTTVQERAEIIVKEIAPYCEKVEIISATKGQIQIKLRRRAVDVPAALFGDDESKFHPFEEWFQSQTNIHWSSKGTGKYRTGCLENVKVMLVVE